MSTYALTRSISQKGLVLPSLPPICLRVFWILTFFSIAAFSILYILQINEMTKVSYLVGGHEKRITVLTQEQEALKINFSQSNSLENIDAQVKSLNFEPVGQIHYIQVFDGTVVTK